MPNIPWNEFKRISAKKTTMKAATDCANIFLEGDSPAKSSLTPVINNVSVAIILNKVH